MSIDQTAQDIPVERKRVLIVDDDREVVSAIRRALMSVKGLEIDVAYDGPGAREKFAAFDPHLVLLDMRMPGTSGYDVCGMIRQQPGGKDVKIIVVSGMMDMEGLEKIAEIGANDFLAKPFRNEFLRLKVERILDL